MSVLQGVLHGGRTGAQLGAIVGPWGAAVGAVVGAVVVGAAAWWLGDQLASHMSNADEQAEEQLENSAPEECTGRCPTELPEDPDDLVEEGWEEEEVQAPNRRRFRNPETGEVIEFDQGQPGMSGWRGRDHYHRPNPNASGRGDAYLDQNGNPVPRGSSPSHIRPGTAINSGNYGVPTS